jgi:hypothetical protein
MATSDQFKTAVQQDNLDAIAVKKALKTVLEGLTELKVTTRIVPSRIVLSDDNNSPTPSSPEHCIQTRINILESRIENEVGSAFLRDGSYGELRDFHAEQVKKSYETLQQNLESLQTLSTLLVDTLD